MSANWFLLQCSGRSDQEALRWLDRAKIETYYPQIREMRPVPRLSLSKKQRASGVKVMRPKLVPLLPRYIFVRIDPLSTPRWREVFDVAGVNGLVVEESGKPIRIRDHELEEVRSREIDGAIPGKTPADMIFRVGEAVRVMDGPFAQFTATIETLPRIAIEEIDSDTRIKVAVGLFGRSTTIDLEVRQIEKIV